MVDQLWPGAHVPHWAHGAQSLTGGYFLFVVRVFGRTGVLAQDEWDEASQEFESLMGAFGAVAIKDEKKTQYEALDIAAAFFGAIADQESTVRITEIEDGQCGSMEINEHRWKAMSIDEHPLRKSMNSD